MEKNTDYQISYLKLLPREILSEILSKSDGSTYVKFLYLTSKQANKEISGAINDHINFIFRQPTIGWKKMKKANIEKAVDVLQLDVNIELLLKQINEWIKTNTGGKKFHEWIETFGKLYIEKYTTEKNRFKTNKHTALYYLISCEIKNEIAVLALLLKDEHLQLNYPFIFKSLKKSYLVALISESEEGSSALKTCMCEFEEFENNLKAEPIFFINLMGIRSIKRFISIVPKIINFTNARLCGTNLSNTDLKNVILNGADLTEADLSTVNLIGVCMGGANLSGANLDNVVIEGLKLSSLNLSRIDLRNIPLDRIDLRGLKLSEATLNGKDLTGKDLSEADLSRADLRGAKLGGANLSGTNLSGALLDSVENCQQTDFNGANVTDMIFIYEHSQTIKQANWNIIKNKIQQAEITQLDKIYEDSIRKGNLWDIQRNPRIDNFFRFFINLISDRKVLTTHRKMLNTEIIKRANELIATASNGEKKQLENLINKVYASESTYKPVSVDVKPIANLRP